MALCARTRASTNRLGYAWRKRRQLDPRCEVDLDVAAGRFSREVHGEPVSNLLAVLACGELSEPSLEQRLRLVEGLAHRVNNCSSGISQLRQHARRSTRENTRLRITVPGPTCCRAISLSVHPFFRVSRASPNVRNWCPQL